MSTWVDTHCHLHMADADSSLLVDRAVEAGVEWLVCPGTDAAGSAAAAAIAASDPRVLATAGLHPHEADRWPQERDRIAALAVDAAAVGECGLDFYRNLAPRDAQVTAFAEQLALADELNKPVVVHCRDAFSEVYDALAASATGPRAVLHCWTGGPRWTRRFSDIGATFSFAGPITFPGGDTVRLGAAVAPRDRTMVETDTPYLTPPPDRRAPNEPANVVKVGVALAGVWGVEPAEVARLTSRRAAEVFGRG